jgi:hypothetical protein
MNRHLSPKALVAIVERGSIKRVAEVFRNDHLVFSLVFLGRGTAGSEVMDLLGLDDAEKAIVLTVLPDFYVGEVLLDLDERLKFGKKVKGFAFTVPLSGAGILFSEKLAQFVQKFDPKLLEELKKAMDTLEKPAAEELHALILTAVREGFADDVMEVARAAGATGGTVFSARPIGVEGAATLFGVDVEPEREIVAIVARRESKKDIMQAINHSCGLHCAAQGVLFSVPVDKVMGL